MYAPYMHICMHIYNYAYLQILQCLFVALYKMFEILLSHSNTSYIIVVGKPVCKYECSYQYIYICIYIYIYIYIHIHTYTRLLTQTFAFECFEHSHCRQICVYAHMQVCVNVSISVCVDMHTYIHR
jgi:hypothetical protein